MFTGRKKELEYLNNYYEKPGDQIVVVYGQKGIGKTALLQNFMKGKESFYYEAIPCSTMQQRIYMADYIKNMGGTVSEISEFQELFTLIEDGSGKKKVFVIDEFQNLCKTDCEFFEALYRFLVRDNKKRDFFIVLCSSFISWVENTMEDKLGEFSRIVSGFYKMKELNYQDFIKCFPDFSKEDSIGAFSILGGIPGLWQYFKNEYSLRENIERVLLQRKLTLFDYGQQYVVRELREPAVYNTLLAAMAQGKRKLNELHQHTGFSRAKISVYLKNLIQLELVEKVVSLDTEGRENTQKGIYQIKHSYVHFYYRYLFPNLTKVKLVEPKEFYEQYIEPSLTDFVSASFKKVCQEFLERENALGRLPEEFVYLGQWIGKKGSIDLVFQDEEEELLAAICNWEKEMLIYEDYLLFLECQESAKLKPEYVILFSKGKFDNRLRQEAKKNPNLALVSLEQIGF